MQAGQLSICQPSDQSYAVCSAVSVVYGSVLPLPPIFTP